MKSIRETQVRPPIGQPEVIVPPEEHDDTMGEGDDEGDEQSLEDSIA